MSAFTIRTATAADAEAIHGFIYELAVYEREPDAVEATPESIRAQMLSPIPPFECILGALDGVPVGMALYFQSYSTWRGVPGIYLEDLYVQPQHRGAGYGVALLAELAAIAVERGVFASTGRSSTGTRRRSSSTRASALWFDGTGSRAVCTTIRCGPWRRWPAADAPVGSRYPLHFVTSTATGSAKP